MQPKEDPAIKAARERERRLAEMELDQTGEKTAADMTADLQRAYGRRFSLFRLRR